MSELETREIHFAVDSHLLQELGERLVGAQHIAVAELVRNAYDADANTCEIQFFAGRIEVVDDGHGMTFDEFVQFWMRIGTTNKQAQGVSRHFKRPLTGSKGIGRLAVQFLGSKVEVITTSNEDGAERIQATVDWDEAVDAGDLTEAVAVTTRSDEPETYADESPHGTKIILTGLKHDWTFEDDDGNTPVRALAREIWMLQPPFAETWDEEDPGAFTINLESEDESAEEAFRELMSFVLDTWDARIVGDIRNGRRSKSCDVIVEFRDGDMYEVSIPMKSAQIDKCQFEVRIFKLYGRMAGRFKIDDAREYFRQFGSVNIYDSGFRLPYYDARQDWLGIEADHSHRQSISQLLPEHLQVPLAMHDLPTTERMFGAVRISTSRELKRAERLSKRRGEYLKINPGRDRLIDNDAFRELRRVVRWSIDYYATRYQLRQDLEVSKLRPDEAPEEKLDRLWETIHEIKPAIPEELHGKLVEEVDDYYDALERENVYSERQTALLAPLAAAGLAALAFEHESNRQLRRLETMVRKLARLDIADESAKDEIAAIADGLKAWIKQHRQSRSMFSALASPEDREDVQRLRLKPTVNLVLKNTRPFLRNVETYTADISDDISLPLGTMADWQALFQNLFVNAANAMLDSEEKELVVSAGNIGSSRSFVEVSDTGAGVDLEIADSLFDPFQRRLEISEDRKSLGLGGTGLGLTIVRMICETRNCSYEFIEPEEGFATTFRMTWRK